MRKIVKNYDGLEFTLSPLNLDQVEEFLAKAAPDAPAKRTIDLVLMSLNNAEPAELWTEAKLRKEIDLVLQGKMQVDILEISGLRSVDDEKTTSSGEAAAASGSGSGKPAAA